MKQTLYHGSYVSVPNPLTGVGRRELDFGPGFYVTLLREQEDYYAGRITAEQAIGQLRFAQPTHQMCISRQSIVDRCLRFITTEQVQQKGGMR